MAKKYLVSKKKLFHFMRSIFDAGYNGCYELKEYEIKRVLEENRADIKMEKEYDKNRNLKKMLAPQVINPHQILDKYYAIRN